MMYFFVAFVLLAVFAYFATLIDDHLEIDSLPVTFVFGFIGCLLWPLTVGLAILMVPLLLIMRWGAKRRGEF